MCLRIFSSIQKRLSFLLKNINFALKITNLIIQVAPIKFINIDYIMIPMLANRAPETYPTGAIFAKAFHIFAAVVITTENISSLF